jgi:hypothetical protein
LNIENATLTTEAVSLQLNENDFVKSVSGTDKKTSKDAIEGGDIQ